MPSPSVWSITTTSYGRRFASVNWVASSVSVTEKFWAAPIAVSAVLPASMASAWRKPVVFENTSTSKRGSCAAAAWAVAASVVITIAHSSASRLMSLLLSISETQRTPSRTSVSSWSSRSLK